MNYTLITKTGRVMQFYILATAECYQQSMGGVIVSQQSLETTPIEDLNSEQGVKV